MSRTAWERRAPDHRITQNDASTTIEDQLRDRYGNVVDLTGASVQYQARFPGGTLAAGIDRAGTIIGTATNGQVRVTVLAADTDTRGFLVEQWRVTFAGGAVERFPPGKHKLEIAPDTAA
jgi:hypothetical protein